MVILGRLTKDVELRSTTTGKSVGSFSLAVNRNWTAEGGKKMEEVTYIEVTAFAKQAETLAEYVKKGNQLLVEGRLRNSEWDDKATGQKRSKLGVVLESFSFVESKEKADAPRGTFKPTNRPLAEGDPDPAPWE